MSVPENIEERLVPYIEGVLNAQEQAEVEQAISADPELGREVDELRQLIGDLKGGFASGVRAPQAELTPQEVALLSVHQGGIENLPGSSELKTRLFLSDDALAEYRLLQSMGKEMAESKLDVDHIPPMPESLRSEFQAVVRKEPKVVTLSPRKGIWGRAGGWLDRINPKPLTAAAAAFAMLSLGVHLYGNNSEPTMAGAEQPVVAFGTDGSKETAPPVLPEIGEEIANRSGGAAATKSPSGPAGVVVFTSGDKELLKEQAEKLLAKNVRYTVTGDRILVAEKHVAEARDVLWGDDGGSTLVAVAAEPEAVQPSPDAEGETRGNRPKPRRLIDKERMPSFNGTPPRAAGAAVKPSSAPPVTTYDLRQNKGSSPSKMREIPGYRADSKRSPKEGDRKGILSTYGDSDEKPSSTALRTGRNSALKSKDSEGTRSQPEDDIVEKPRPALVAKGSLKKETPEARKQRLRDLALGIEPEESDESPAEGSDRQETDYVNEKESVNYQVNRARTAPPEPSTERTAPVANAVTIDLESKTEGTEIASADQSQDKMPSTTVAGELSRKGEADWTNIPINEESSNPGGGSSAPPPSPPALKLDKPAQTVKVRRGPGASQASSDSEGRVAAVRSSQAAVARRYNVVLSVENRGSKINVYVRPRGELTKAEREELRQAIRSELGLSAQDSIIFR